MGETDSLFSQGKLKHFQGSSRTIDGVNRTIHVISGRMSNSALKALSGQEELPIVSSTTKLAHMIVLSAHKSGGHKMASDTLARTRLIAYIYKPGNLIKRVLDSCCLCKIKMEKSSQQLMGKLPLYKVGPTPPFQNVSIDLVGPFSVKPTLASRTQIKTWILMYLCDVSKALHTEIVDSIASTSIINAFRSCFSYRNTPAQISTDPGTSLIGAKNKLQGELDKIANDVR